MEETKTGWPAPLERLVDETLAEYAFRRMRADLLSGRLEPGKRLRVNELQGLYELGLSPLREALLRLTTEGLVVAEGQRGFAVPPLSEQELIDLTNTRQTLEALALTDSVTRGDAAWEAGVVASFHLLSRAPLPSGPDDLPTIAVFESAHRTFHDAMVAACGSPWMLRLLGQLVDHSERYRQARMFDAKLLAKRARNIEGEHRALMEAALAHDAATACALMREHISRTMESALRALRAQQKKTA